MSYYNKTTFQHNCIVFQISTVALNFIFTYSLLTKIMDIFTLQIILYQLFNEKWHDRA